MSVKHTNKLLYSKEWKQFRDFMYKSSGKKDAVTNKPLRQGHWECHHLDPDHYEDLQEEKFVCLNNKTHELIHFLYRTIKYQPLEITLSNIVNILMRMWYYEHPEYGKPKRFDVVFSNTGVTGC